MRKLTGLRAAAAGSLLISLQAGAVTTVYDVSGTLAGTEMSCTAVTALFTTGDCTYGRNRPGLVPNKWVGPFFGGGHYNLDGVKDQTTYVPTAGDQVPNGTGSFIPAVDDGKIAAPITGTFSINDNQTPGDASDDKISGAFTIGQMARNQATGATTRAVQRWTAMDHVMAEVTVSSATSDGSGGVIYVVASRGFPAPLCSSVNASDCFPSPSAMTDIQNDNQIPFWTAPPAGSIGIERSGLMGEPGFVAQPPPVPFPPNFLFPETGNLGASSTATFTGLTCNSNDGQPQNAGQCATSQLIWGSSQENAGFDNILLKVTVTSAGAMTVDAFWVEEYLIGIGIPIPGYNNSWQGGKFALTGQPQSSGADARDFAVNVLQGSTGNTLDTLTNSVNFNGTKTVTIITPPTKGTATVNGDQTINYDSTGATGTDTIVYQTTAGSASDQGTITITIAADTAPVAPDGAITASTQGAAPGAGTAGNVNVASLGGYAAGNLPSVVSITTAPNVSSGTATVAGTTITFTPAATFFAGTDTIGYTITDSDDDTDAGVITVTVPDVSPAIADGAITTDQDEPSSQLPMAINPGNGSVAQHVLAVSTAATHGTCAITGTSLRYTPEADYFGPDSCVVRITDGDGDQDTGTFTITVNEVNTGLILPGGSSSLDLWSLSLLGALPLLRRRRRT